jgi:hypothetical protein
MGELPSLRGADDVLREVEELLRDTKAQANSARRTGALCAVLSLALRTLEVGELESRLEALEKIAWRPLQAG